MNGSRWHGRPDRGGGGLGRGHCDRCLAVQALATLAAVQEVIDLLEAYVVLAWLGASPRLATVVALEGGNRALNAAGQLIPGKLGVSEIASTILAMALKLGRVPGLTLALAHRARSVLWGAAAITVLTYRAAVRPAAARGPAFGYL